MGQCSRCGSEAETQYGADGLAYCSACLFYGLNKQCARCRMYLPSSELQQYKGMWACPYCIMDMRSEDRQAEYKPEPRKDKYLDILSYPERCERCGRDLENTVYIWNDRKLCKKCVEDGQDSWGIAGGGPMSSPQLISTEPIKKAKERSIIEAFFSEFLAFLRIKPREDRQVIIIKPKMPIEHAKPMADTRLSAKPMPQAEGLMTKKKRKSNKNKKVDAEKK